MRPAGVLDTNTLILLADLREEDLPVRSFVSTVTIAELSVGPLLAVIEDEREVRQGQLEIAMDMETLPFDDAAAQAFAAVASSLRTRGRKVEARRNDALIAATALSRGLPLYTCNPDDFADIDGLEVVAVPHPDKS